MEVDYRQRSRTAALEWLPVIAGLLILYVPTFYELANTIWHEDDYAHGPIILAVIFWLIWDRRQVLLSDSLPHALGFGLTLLLFGLLVYILGRSQAISVFEIGALIPIFAGILLAMRGWRALHAMSFMLLFIVYLVPLPETMVDTITGTLKHHVSAIAESILYALHYPIARNGVMLTIGPYQLLVADACSGLNSMFSVSSLGLLYLYLMRYRSWLHNGLIVASLLPIAFGANVVRVLILVLVTYHFGDAAGQGFLHAFSGIVLFIVTMIVVYLFDMVLVRAIRREA